MNTNGFKDYEHWYKGNLHSHTTVSDGLLEPVESVAFFKNNGYDFLCLSDHDIYSDYGSQFCGEDFLLLPGIEYSAVLYADETRTKRLKIHHLHGILGTEAMQENASLGLLTHLQRIPPLLFEKKWDGSAVAQQMADMLAGHGCFTTYNHPIWSRVEERDFTHTTGLWGLEIFNYNTVQESSTGYDTTHWDTMLRRGMAINAFASDDNHNEGLFDDALGGWVCVQSPSLTHKDIVSNLLAGNYYSSSGPEIYNWGIKDGVATIQCSSVNRIHFICGNIINDGTTILSEKEVDGLTTASYSMKGHEHYLRIECTDKFGRTAWTNPIYFDGR